MCIFGTVWFTCGCKRQAKCNCPKEFFPKCRRILHNIFKTMNRGFHKESGNTSPKNHHRWSLSWILNIFIFTLIITRVIMRSFSIASGSRASWSAGRRWTTWLGLVWLNNGWGWIRRGWGWRWNWYVSHGATDWILSRPKKPSIAMHDTWPWICTFDIHFMFLCSCPKADVFFGPRCIHPKNPHFFLCFRDIL